MYDYEKISSEEYIFKTLSGITYSIVFKPTPYLFNDETLEYSKFIFELIVLVLINQNDIIELDEEVGETVAEIIKIFYAENQQKITIYICDSSDNRQLVRQRKFTQWWNKYAPSELSKTDYVIEDNDLIRLPISVFLNLKNPYYFEILSKFNTLIIENSK